MDSVLALALVRETGRKAFALHGRFLPGGEREARLGEELERLCQGIGVALHVVDLSREFREIVIEPFKRAYAEGLTPNPCAACNRDVKFGLLADVAIRHGAESIATGHYARLGGGEDGQRRAGLYRGADPVKDQSYFLALTPREALVRAVFPLGGWKKEDVPAALAKRGLVAPLPAESQEICFVPGDDYRAFLEAEGVMLAGGGPVVLPDGREIGRHGGLWRYTVGQRKGIGVAWSEPLYVLDKIIEGDVLVVGPRQALWVRECRVREVNVLVEVGEWPDVVRVQTCYRQRPAKARADWNADGAGLGLRFEADVPRPTPGQVAALFDEDGRVLAGGIIA